MEVFKSLPEGTFAEVIQDSLYMSPAPGKSHQRILRRLFTQIDHFVTEKNQVRFSAPLSMYFWMSTPMPCNLTCYSFQMKTVTFLMRMKRFMVCRI